MTVLAVGLSIGALVALRHGLPSLSTLKHRFFYEPPVPAVIVDYGSDGSLLLPGDCDDNFGRWFDSSHLGPGVEVSFYELHRGRWGRIDIWRAISKADSLSLWRRIE